MQFIRETMERAKTVRTWAGTPGLVSLLTMML